MLGTVLLGFAVFTRNFVRASNTATLRAMASDLAVLRIEAAKAEGYAGIDAYAGTQTNVTLDSSSAASPRFTQRTVVRRTATVAADYKTITVTVTHPALAAAVSKSTTVAAF